MNKLWVRLALAFGAVTIIGILVAGLLANRQVNVQFRRFVARDQIVNSPLVTSLADYYVQNGSWAGVETLFDDMGRPEGMMMGHGQGMMRRGMPQLILADASTQVVFAQGGSRRGTPLTPAELAEAVPIELEGQTVGYVLISVPGQADLSGPAQAFLRQFNVSLWQAGLVAGGLGVLLGLAIARGLSAPLGRLALAARRISQGDLSQRVPVSGSAEVAGLARAFNEMAAGLQQAETLRRSMVADIAHELRTPLTVMQGNLQAILDDVYPMEKAEIAAVYDETLILSRLIGDLRELAQAEAGQLSLNLQPVELAPLIERAASLFEELARDKKVKLTVALPASLPSVWADSDRVRQVLHNLLANALRHTPEGGEIGIVVEESQWSENSPLLPLRQAQDIVRTFAPPQGEGGRRSAVGGQLRVTVADTGPGIPAEDLPHIFNRFWRGDRARSREQGGSGLGLAIARQLVEAQGGHIGVESDGVPGHGSRFWFTLPVAASISPV
ncbi:MAG: HAMP domain-containing protein [Anaerolineales bacterium]|nr:HAMP domain-containing protein [Anaerolineales bacterium]